MMSCITQSLFIMTGTQTSDVLLYQDGRKLVGLDTTKNKQTKRVEIHITKTEDKEKHKLLEQHQSCFLPLCHDLAELVTTVDIWSLFLDKIQTSFLGYTET